MPFDLAVISDLNHTDISAVVFFQLFRIGMYYDLLFH